jgi:murein DD-endopeptidase MepM/ murein hydrolase activator NlpD
MPEGTPVLAALGGKVVRVVDGFTLCCRKLEEAWQTNEVIIRHPSGLFSSYVHLRKGVVVREGERVAAGALIGYSGSTGYANGPHLHFSVSARKTADSVETIPIRFRNGTPQGFVPKHWHLYDSRAKPGIALRVTIDGTPVVSGQPFPVADHSPVQLKVEILDAAGVGFDVTRSATTEYVALTPWSLRADRMGRVQFDLKTKTWEILPDLIERGIAILTVLTRDANGSEGYFDVWFKFGDVALPKSEAQPGA